MKLRILSINPGSRYLGIAVLIGTDLREWAVKAIGSSQTKALTVICDLVQLYEVNTLALKKLHPARTSKRLGDLVSQIKRLAKMKASKLREYTIADLKSRLLSEEHGNKKSLIDQVLARYSFLFSEADHERKSKNPYLIRMFEAVAIGIVCHDELDSMGRKVGKTMK